MISDVRPELDWPRTNPVLAAGTCTVTVAPLPLIVVFVGTRRGNTSPVVELTVPVGRTLTRVPEFGDVPMNANARVIVLNAQPAEALLPVPVVSCPLTGST